MTPFQTPSNTFNTFNTFAIVDPPPHLTALMTTLAPRSHPTGQKKPLSLRQAGYPQSGWRLG